MRPLPAQQLVLVLLKLVPTRQQQVLVLLKLVPTRQQLALQQRKPPVQLQQALVQA